MDWNKYRSRKFLMSIAVLGATVGLAYLGKMDAHVGLVLTGLIASYNAFQGMIDKHESK